MAVPIFLVGTRFQAVMANSVADYLDLAAFDLVVFHHGDMEKTETDKAFLRLVSRADRIVLIDRRISERQQTKELLNAVGSQTRTVFVAQISAPFVMSIFPFRRHLCLQTFDEGTFNIREDGPFGQVHSVAVRSIRDALIRAAFPKGAIAIARKLSDRHYTAFPAELNLMADISVRIPIDWPAFLEDSDAQKAKGIRTIMVLPCFQDFTGTPAERDRILERAKTCDLVVRHPRDLALKDVPSVCLHSPVEALIDKAREFGAVQVFHFGSTVGLTTAGWDGVTAIDLSQG